MLVLTLVRFVKSRNNSFVISTLSTEREPIMENLSKTALLLIDFQNDYFLTYEGAKWPLLETEKAAFEAEKLLCVFRQNDLPVIHVRHEFLTDDAPFFLPDSDGAQIHESLAPIEGENVIVKQHINSFRDTNLKAQLEAFNVTNLVIVGAMSHMCVDAVTRAANDFGYVCSVAHDACTTCDLDFNDQTVTAVQVHNATMAALGFGYAEVKTADALVSDVIDKQALFSAVVSASHLWASAFNASDAEGCAAQYEHEAVMHAKPFGTFQGRDNIQQFWTNLINDGFADVVYLEPKIQVLDERSVILTSGWKMNNAAGVIHKELWVLQADGTAKLREDDFEVTA